VRVHRSFAFVDVSGFTALTEHEGDEHAVEVLSAFRALLRDNCSWRGVRIAKWLGDGVMLVCVDNPTAAGHDHRTAPCGRRGIGPGPDPLDTIRHRFGRCDPDGGG